MSTLTATEWNERYPVGTPALWLQPSGVRPVACTVVGTAHDDADGVARVTVISGVGGVPNSVRLAHVEPLATDEERRTQGWLDPEAAVTISPRGRYRLVGPDGVWVVTGLSTAGDTAELHLRREPQPPCPECGPGYRLGDEGCRHG